MGGGPEQSLRAAVTCPLSKAPAPPARRYRDRKRPSRDAWPGKDNDYGYGRIDAAAALAAVPRPQASRPPRRRRPGQRLADPGQDHDEPDADAHQNRRGTNGAIVVGRVATVGYKLYPQ